nr:MAG TPA: hypothetical protein [Caudoviricetes sp.]
MKPCPIRARFCTKGWYCDLQEQGLRSGDR